MKQTTKFLHIVMCMVLGLSVKTTMMTLTA